VKDLPEIPDNVKDGLEIIPVENVSQVLEHALVSQPQPIEWDEAEELDRPRPAEDDAAATPLAH